MLLPYRVKVSDTTVTHFTPILALCTCLCRLHLRKPVSMKQTKHSRKSEAQNLCSKCPRFARTHAFKRLRHCAIADGFAGSVHGLRSCTSWNQGFRSTVTSLYYRNTVLLYASAGYPLCFRGLLRFSARWGTSTSCTWHCHHAAERETPEFIPPEMWPPNPPDLNPVDYSIWGILQLREGLPLADPWCEGVERTSVEGVEAAGPCTVSSRQRLRSGVVVWMHVFAWIVDILNINFEPLNFCYVLFVSSILVALNVIDINMCKVLILGWNVLFLCLRLSHGMVAT